MVPTLVSLLSLVGCSSVDLEGDPFGPVMSALWYSSEEDDGVSIENTYTWDPQSGLASYGPATYTPLSLRSGLWSCADTAAHQRRRAALSEDVLAAEDDAERCDALGRLHAFYESQDREPERYLGAWPPDYTAGVPDRGTDDVHGYVAYDAADRCSESVWNAETCSVEREEDPDCETDDAYYSVQGTLEIVSASKMSVTGTISGEAEQYEPEERTAPIEVSFSATYCTLPRVENVVWL